MSLSNFIGDILSGNFSHAEQRIKDWWGTVSPEIQSFIATLESNEGQILQGLVTTAAQDVITGGLTTASFVAAAKDVESKLVAQNITLGQQTIFAALNAVVAGQTVKAS